MLFPYQNIVVLTGAGISAESGIQTFRAENGLWEGHSIEEVATPEGFLRAPEKVLNFYNQRRAELLAGIVPNPAHQALAKLANELKGQFTLITQNIDNLHEKAASLEVIHMHGELLKARCAQCEAVIDWQKAQHSSDSCPVCQAVGKMRPHIVWFGEMPLSMDKIYARLMQADLFIAIGTSGAVYPAAGFVREAALNGVHTIEINLAPSAVENEFAEKRYGKASVLVPILVDEILNAQALQGA